MRILSIELSDFRGLKHLKVGDIPATGVTIIHGRNEAGKTTILKAIEALFNYKYSSKATAVKSLQTVNADVSPEAIMEFSVGPYQLKLSKRWLKQSSALLEVIKPRPETFKGEEAESQLNEILANHLDKNLFDAMFLNQDDLHKGINAAGISSVAGVLSNQTGEASAAGKDAESATELMKQVDATYERYYSLKTGIESKELKAARAEHVAAVSELEEASRALAELSGFVERYEYALEQQRSAASKIPKAEKEVKETAEQLQKVEELKSTVSKLEMAENLAQSDLELAQSHLNSRVEIRESLAEADKQVKQLAGLVESAEDKARQEQEKVSSLNEEVDKAKKHYAAARERSKQARSARAELLGKREAFELTSKATKVETCAKNLSEVRTSIEKFGPAVTDKDVQRIEKLEQDLVLNRRLREAAVAKLVLSASTPQQITVNGENTHVGEDESNVELTPGLILEIGDLTARYEPGTTGNSTKDVDVVIEELTESLHDELEKLGCDNSESVREKRVAYRELLEQKRQLQDELSRVLEGEELEQLRARAAAIDAVKDVPTAEDFEEVEKEIVDAENDEEAASNALDNAEAKLKPWGERPARNELIQIKTKADQALENRQRLESEAKELERNSSDESLEQKVHAHKQRLAQAHEATEVARNELQVANPGLAQDLAKGSQAQLDNLQRQYRDAEKDQYLMSSQIQMQTGVAERVEVAEAEEESARNLLRAVEQRAHAVKHLREVLLRHQTEARERYAAPFAQQLGHLASRVFNGEVEFHLNEDLVVEKRTLNGITVGLEDLSGGAKEQMAILTRFAIAELLSAGGETGAPVVVDDALGSTDANRIRLMATLFADVGESSQVIVFTCEPSRYDRVPDSTLLDIDQLKRPSAIG